MTHVDKSLSRYVEVDDAKAEFNRHELRDLRTLLRRLQFLEAQVRENGGLSSGEGGAAWAELERDALEFVLTDIGYLTTRPVPATAGAQPGRTAP